MKKYRLVDNDELIATSDDLQTLVRTTDELPVPSADNCGQTLFLRTSCRIGSRFYLRGRVYKCVSHYETDPETGIKILVYSWEIATYSESGALDKVTDVHIESATGDYLEYGTNLYWNDPVDKKYRDSSNNATWGCTIIVRKFVPDGDDPSIHRPKSVNDGTIVGMSGVRDQYAWNNGTGSPFIDHYPAGLTPVYNIFAVTTFGVATGLDQAEEQELTWDVIQDIIRRGQGGTIFNVGDCVTIEHSLLGSIDLQVAHMGLIPIRTSEGDIAARHGVIFISRECLPRCTYDAKEYRTYGNVVNPADKISAADSEYYASNRGRADWVTSNLRQFLNSSTKFTLSEDRKWNIGKFYFTLEDGNYIQLPIPIWPDRVDPKALGYYEAEYVFVPKHNWDEKAGSTEQACVYGRRELPGFYEFLPADLRGVLADAIVPTIGSKLTNEPTVPRLIAGYKSIADREVSTVFLDGQLAEDKLIQLTASTTLRTDYQYVKKSGDNYNLISLSAVTKDGSCYYYLPVETKTPVVLTEDKIFIPSHKELFGSNTKGFFGNEGQFWTLFNPAIEIPDLGETRSHLKYDVEGKLTGYYTRSLGLIETFKDVFAVRGDSSVWTVKSKGFISPPPLGTPVRDVAPCSMTKAEAIKKDAAGTLTAPGVAWCCVVAYSGRES